MTDLTPKRMLVIGINFTPELTGIGKYTAEMVDWMADNNFDCTVITAFPYYPHWKVQSPYKGKFYKRETLKEGRITLYRCPFYVPKKPSGTKRILHDASFFVSAFLVVFLMLFKRKQDYIFCVAPPFHLGFMGLFYRFFKGGKMIYHMQDLQVDAAKELEIIKSRRLLNILFRLEKYILDRTNVISSISNGMIGKIRQKTEKNVLLFPNWVDTERFYPLKTVDAAKKQYGFFESDKIILYSGSIGEKQGLESIIYVANKLKDDASIKFVISGSGPYKEKLKKTANDMDLTNVLFYPLQPTEKLNNFLNIADVHLVIQKACAGDLVMPSKLTTILAVGGLAIVTSDPGLSLYTEVSRFSLGILCAAENSDVLLSTVRDAVRNKHKQIKINARDYAEKILSTDTVISNYVALL